MTDARRKIGEIFSPAQLKKAMKIGPNQKTLLDRIVLPNIKDIEKRCGQEMNASYLSYMLEYALTKSSSVY